MRNYLTSLFFISTIALAGCSKADEGSSPSEAASPNEARVSAQAPAPAAKPTSGAASSESSLAKAAGSYTIDPGHTQLVFRTNHLGRSEQYGMFTKTEGSFVVGKTLSESSISLEVSANSVFTALKKRDDHLKGPDFFDAKQFPSITFKSDSVRDIGNNRVAVAGTLSMHGISKDLSIELEHGGSGTDPASIGGAFRTGFNGEFTLRRSDFGINYMPGGLGDEITVFVALEGTRN